MGKYSKYAFWITAFFLLLYAGIKSSKHLYLTSPTFYKNINVSYFIAESFLFPHYFLDMKSVSKTLQSKHFHLELLEPRHFEEYIESFSHRIRNHLDLHPDLQNQGIASWLDFEVSKQKYGRQITYVIIDSDNRVGGSISISKVPLPDHGQIFGWINEKHWGSGITQETIRLALGEFFKVSGETESNAFVQPHNVRCYKALKKIGFEPAGRTGSAANPGAYIVKITAKMLKKFEQKSHLFNKKNHEKADLKAHKAKTIDEIT